MSTRHVLPSMEQSTRSTSRRSWTSSARCRALVIKVAGFEDAETLLTSLQHHLHVNHGLCVQLRTQPISSYDQLENKSRAQISSNHLIIRSRVIIIIFCEQ